jgi:hypothetical protein
MADKDVEDLRWLIKNAEPHELFKFQADCLCKHERQGQPISVRGHILDAMDADRITVKQAIELLRLCRERRGESGQGMARVDEDGELVTIGGTHGG